MLKLFLSQAPLHVPVAVQDPGYEPRCMVRPHRGRVRSRFIPAPSKASPSIYAKGWTRGQRSCGHPEQGPEKMELLRHGALCSRRMLLEPSFSWKEQYCWETLPQRRRGCCCTSHCTAPSTTGAFILFMVFTKILQIIRCGLALWGNWEMKDHWHLLAHSQQNTNSGGYTSGEKGRLFRWLRLQHSKESLSLTNFSASCITPGTSA